MKRYLSLLLLAFTIAGAATTSTAQTTSAQANTQDVDTAKRHLEAIEQNISKNARGIDIGYKAGTLSTLVAATKQTVMDDLAKLVSADTLDVDKLLNIFSTFAERAKQEGETNTYLLYTGMTENVTAWNRSQPADKAFTVYKYTYTIKNLADKTKRVTVTNYYFFDHNDSFVGHVDEPTMREYKEKLVSSPLQPYWTLLTARQKKMTL